MVLGGGVVGFERVTRDVHGAVTGATIDWVDSPRIAVSCFGVVAWQDTDGTLHVDHGNPVEITDVEYSVLMPVAEAVRTKCHVCKDDPARLRAGRCPRCGARAEGMH